MLLPPIWQQKGGVSTLEILTNFFLSVMAGVISYYICKWLNGR
nr:MAG TPA: SCIMP protein [Caudoviricetes sp.]